MSETGTQPRHVRESLADPKHASNVQYYGPVRSTSVAEPPTHRTDDDLIAGLRELAAAVETTTEFGSASYVSKFRSRSADRTKNAVDDDFGEADYAVIDRATEAVENRAMLCVDRLVGTHPEATFCCRLYVPVEYARIAHAWAMLFEPTDGRDPDFVTVQVPDADETAIRILPDDGFTAVVGSDYTGEAKKSFLRLFMHRAKRLGGLGLHAGSKRVRVARAAGDDSAESENHLEREDGTDADADPDLETVGQLFMGLSATGKSTLTAHGCWLEAPEEAVMVQDDVCALLPDGSVAGSEGGGLYVKTHGLDADEQPGIHAAVTDESAALENVVVDEDGTVDFEDDRYTKNGRAVIRRSELPSASEDIDLEDVDQLFFITRNPLMPPVARLDDEQAAVAFMLGESIETSAGDPDRAGERIRVVGTNPFIIGPEGEEGNRLRELVASLDLECYVVNTGTVGYPDASSKDVGVTESVTILTELARGTVEWTRDEQLGLDVPANVPGMDVEAFRVADYVDDYDGELETLREERREYLESFERLDQEIVDAVY
ncbi:phosphoenolpyruvate carboxykinase (ATP) [Natronosalvus caseinilyticus]|uniref:phosphoenolpyruvate carboxykinase (ATP) n=1 Tax=Natronosalvus caseinilyticus TaxID=2953747 RepID=UPI0028AC8EC3|nr:phosphoenolpyruvate carboxykinase (ATP) [Natronosalvus caseinilyticus]